jgi:hypothetical protein
MQQDDVPTTSATMLRTPRRLERIMRKRPDSWHTMKGGMNITGRFAWFPAEDSSLAR